MSNFKPSPHGREKSLLINRRCGHEFGSQYDHDSQVRATREIKNLQRAGAPKSLK